MTTPTVQQLAGELEAAYELIETSIPLALRYLKSGSASLQEQCYFWNAVHGVEEHIDLLDDMDSSDPFNNGPAGLNDRKEELMSIHLGEEDREPTGGEA